MGEEGKRHFYKFESAVCFERLKETKILVKLYTHPVTFNYFEIQPLIFFYLIYISLLTI